MNAKTTERKPDAGISLAHSEGGEGLAQAFGGNVRTQSTTPTRQRRTREQREADLERLKYTGANAVDGL